MTARPPLPERFVIDRIETPIGVALVVADAHGALRFFDWSDHEDRLRRLTRRYYGDRVRLEAGAAREALGAYFAGRIHALEGLAWESAGTPFQLSVWRALCDIPVGETISYGELARRIGSPRAVRAVGLANGANPIGLIAPCHRVIGADGSLTGYGGGLHRKRWLLRHEGAAFRDEGWEPPGPSGAKQ
jgi:methylated-DNA-[protein]-cysteine S-methyltransferase